MGDTNKLTLVQDGTPRCSIVLSVDASLSERHGAKELQRFLQQMTGAYIPIVEDQTSLSGSAIWIGLSDTLQQKGFTLDMTRLKTDGFVIEQIADGVVIAGSRIRGTLNGVYGFLEDVLGCRWYTPNVSHIPVKPTIAFEGLSVEQVPDLEYRESFFYTCFNGDWAARNRMNGNFLKQEPKHGDKIDYSELFVHTFDHFVPVERHFAENPEYFSEINGERISDRTQLCLTNPDVLALVIAGVRQWIEDHPGIRILSVSQNDWYNPCTCTGCKDIDDREESHSGTLLHFVNQVAEAIESEYPQVAIDTIAYQYTRKAPKYIKPRHNVIVRLCSIECCFSHPLEHCQEAVSFKNRTGSSNSFATDLKEWAKVSERLYIWDYVTNFSNYVMPFPNMRVLKPNIEFFKRNNVKGIFEQGSYAEGGGGEFAEVRGYLIAKLLWNSDIDVSATISEFMKAYYGPAADPLITYIEALHNKVEEENIHVGIYDPPINAYLTDEMLALANACFDEAERLALDPVIAERVHRARLPIRYVELSIMPVHVPNRKAKIAVLFGDMEKAGIQEIWESRSLEKSRMFMEEGTVFNHSSLRSR